MRTQLICIWIVAVSSASLVNCTKVVSVSMEEVRQTTNMKVVSADIPVAIVGAKLTTGESITFSEPTGQYVRERQHLAGRTQLGDSVNVPLKQVAALFLQRLDMQSLGPVMISPTDFLLKSQLTRSVSYKGTLFPWSEQIMFDHGGAVIDTVSNTIAGHCKEGLNINTSLSNICDFGVRRFSPWKTLLGVTTCAGIIIVASAIAWYHDPEWVAHSD